MVFPSRLGWLSVVASLCLSSVALAQSTDAEVLFDRARALMAERRYDEAAVKLEESQRLDPGVGTLLNLAECYVKLGRTASAWSTYRAAAAAAAAAKDKPREALAAKREAELAGQLVHLTVSVPPAARVPGLVVTRGGAPVSAALWGEPVPVDPGSVELTASAPGHRSWHHTQVVDSTTPQVGISVPVLEVESATVVVAPSPAPEAQAPPPPVTTGGQLPRQESGEPAPPSGASTQRLLGYVTGGAGLVLAGVGTALYVASQATIRDANCPGERCVIGVGDPAKHEEGRREEQRSFAVIGVGGALLVAGVVIVLTAPADAPVPAMALGFGAGPSGPAVRLSGSF